MSTNTHSDTGLAALRDALRRFAADRDWDKFHSPKNLASALAVESAELVEHFGCTEHGLFVVHRTHQNANSRAHAFSLI